MCRYKLRSVSPSAHAVDHGREKNGIRVSAIDENNCVVSRWNSNVRDYRRVPRVQDDGIGRLTTIDVESPWLARFESSTLVLCGIG